MPIRTNGGVFDEQMLTGSLRHFVLEGADFSGAVNQFGQPVPFSAAEIIFTNLSRFGFINIMNPNQYNLSFALEINRSDWDGPSITTMVRSLGNDVGVDHVDCTSCTCTEVPYIWDLGSGPGTTSFLQLTDTPSTYAGSAGYVVTVNPGETGLIFTPNTGGNSFAHVASPSQPTINAGPNDTLTLIAGTNTTITTNAGARTVTFNSLPVPEGYTPIAPGNTLQIGKKYFVTGAGTVTLPALTGSGITQGSAIVVTKVTGQPTPTVFVNVGNVSDTIATDLGSTNSIEYDATAELIFIASGTVWNLQIGSYNH
jgi:hypothetical protein